MKKSLIALLCMCLMFSVIGCGPGLKEEEPEKPQVESETDEKKPEKAEKPEEKEEPEEEPKEEGFSGTLKFYLPDDNFMELVGVNLEVESELPKEQAIFEMLKLQEVIGPDSELLSFEVKDRQIDLNVNKAFGDYLRNMGTTGEYFIMGGMINTYLDAYDCDGLQVKEEGEILVSGHAEFNGYQGRYE